MRLEPLCRLTMRYEEGAWPRPFGGDEGAGYGWGEGSFSGDVLRGTMRWSNSPRRREDGVWTPNLRGVLRTDDGAEILVSMHGQSVQEQTDAGIGRAILARVEFLTEHDAYRWLNTSFRRRRGRDRRGDGGVVARCLRLRQRARGAPSRDRSGAAGTFPLSGRRAGTIPDRRAYLYGCHTGTHPRAIETAGCS